MPRQVGSSNPELSELDFENIVGKIMVLMEPVLIEDIPENEWITLNNSLLGLIHKMWSSKPETWNTLQVGTTKYARRRARELFGGHCMGCARFDPEVPCPTLDKNFPGCIHFTSRRKSCQKDSTPKP